MKFSFYSCSNLKKIIDLTHCDLKVPSSYAKIAESYDTSLKNQSVKKAP